MYIKAIKKDLPLCYTVEAQTKIAAKAGRLEDLKDLFEKENSAETVENIIWVLAILMEAAVNREKVKCKMLGEDYKGGEPPSYDELRLLIEVKELGKETIKEIFAAMSNGSQTTVEVKEEKGKNAKATQ